MLRNIFFTAQDDNKGGTPSGTTENKVTKPVETEEERKRRQAMEYSARLNKDKAKLQDEAAVAAGFKDWEDMQANSLNKRLLEQGIQPETGAPIVREIANDLVSRDPRVVEAEKIIAERKAEKEKSALTEINTRFGTQFSTLDDLDADTKTLIEKGIDPFKAYLANHYESLPVSTQTQQSQQQILAASKQHLNTVPGGSGGTQTHSVNLSADELNNIRKITGMNMTDAEITKFLADRPGIKIPK